MDAPIGVPESYEEHVGLMYDLLAIAYQADLTRVFTFMAAREISARTYPQAGVPEQHHQVSHHGNDPDKIAKTAKINTYHSQLLREVPREAAIDARRRRLAARPLADLLRRRHGQSESARGRHRCRWWRSAAARAGEIGISRPRREPRRAICG